MTRTAFRTLAAAAALLLVPMAAAPTSASADSPVVARISVPANHLYELAGGMGAVWLASVDGGGGNPSYSTLRRIDPRTNRISASYPLDSAAAGLAIADGSIWVSMYYDNVVERLDARGHVLARIHVGLQPIWLHRAFGSVWVSNHHGRSVTRIDPRTNRVIATLPAGDQHMFRSGPQQMTDDGHYLYIYSSNGTQPFERIDPRTNTVSTHAAPVNCGDIVAIAGSVWTTNCSDTVTINQLDSATGAVRHTITFAFPQSQPSMTAHHGALWVVFDTAFDDQTGIGSGGTINELNPRTGAVERQLTIGGDASTIRSADGDLWVLDNTNGMITRLHPA